MIRKNLIFVLTYLLMFRTMSIHPTDVTREIVTIQGSRRQNRPSMIMPPKPPRFKKKTGKDDDYYEPYWEKGDWVFYRKVSTNKPQGFFLNTGSTKHTECNQICLQIYQDYGIICGMRLTRDEWTHEFQTFDNMCYLELANCVSRTKRYDWYPIKKGNCTDGITTHPTDPTAIATRKLMWEKRFP